MKNIKTYYSSLFLFLFSAISMPLVIHGSEFDPLDFDQNLEAFEQQTDLVRDHLTAVDPCDIIITLGLINGIPLLQEDIYLRTNPINKRSILDYPHWVLAQQQEGMHRWTIGSHFFYNQTTRCNFTSKSSCIKDYLAVNSEDLLEKIGSSVIKIKELFPSSLNPFDILALFHPFTVQERRTGLMMHFMRDFANTRIRFYLPLYYIEHNYFVDDETKFQLEQTLGTLSTESQAQFQKDHLVSDKFGLGDSRFELEFPIFEREHFFARVGGRITVPTAWAFSTGMMGSHFNRCCPRPTNFLTEVLGLLQDSSLSPAEQRAAMLAAAQPFGLAALDHLGANLLETNLGNGGHWGLGGYAYSDLILQKIFPRPWAKHVVWRNKAILEYLTPKEQTRYFIKKINLDGFATRNFLDDDSQCASNLAFLEQRLTDQFFPLALQVTVQPGVMFNWVSEFQYNGKHFRPAIGVDLWFQAPEELSNIQGHEMRMNQLDIVRAKAPTAYQAKVFGSIGGLIERPTRDWFVSLNGDYTVLNSGIGADYTVTFNFQVNF